MRSVRLLGLCALAFAAGCAALGDEHIGAVEQMAQPIDRLIIGKAAVYPADGTLHDRAPVLEQSMAERRKAAWAIVEKVLQPVRIATASSEDGGEALELPRFQTWYSREDVMPMFDRLFRGLSDDDKRARSPFTSQAIADVFPWNAAMATSLASFTAERLAARKKELANASGLHSLGKDTRVLMSPGYVEHVLGSYQNLLGCNARVAAGPSFAPCLDGEFPAAAAAVKTRWMPGSAPVPTYDTSAPSLANKLESGTFGEGDGKADPDDASAYTMRLTPDTTMRLVALHIMTKELRDWAWITLWWSPDADSDFGADRPASLTGTFAHYKMCVATAYGEKDAAPGSSFRYTHPSLADALDATAKDGPSSWCSNPYLETQEHAAKTNCIGCHQHGGTGETVETVLGAPDRFPDFGRTKLRASFPADYTFTTDGGLELTAGMRARAEALTPP